MINAISSLRPGCRWRCNDGDYSSLEWDESNSIGPPTLEEIEVEIIRLTEEYKWINLRQTRNRLLSETDWWVLPDRTCTQEQLNYRQALRDLPNNIVDPSNPNWPIKPQ